MYAVEFNAKILNGRIDIPERYRKDFMSDVKVIIQKLDNITSVKSYDALMKEAGNDRAYLTRTIACADDFVTVDSEVSGEW